MADAALVMRRNVINLPGCCDSGVMAGCTITAHDVQVMHKGTSEGIETVVDDMARGTVLAGYNMACRFPCAYIAIMAAQAVAGIRAVMVKQGTDEAGRSMAVGAVLSIRCCRDVIR